MCPGEPGVYLLSQRERKGPFYTERSWGGDVISSPFCVRFSARGLAGIAFLCACCAGCGLADYEARMDLQQRKLKYVEEQNQNLEPYKVLLSDRKPDDDLAREEFFLRPPKGLDGNGDEKTVGADIVHFSGKGNSALTDMWIAAVKRDNDVKFQKDVLELLKINPRQKKPKTVEPVGSAPLNYDWVHDEQGARGTYDAYFYKKAPYLVAIVFKIEGSKEQALLQKQMDYSLATMRLASEAKTQKVPRTPPSATSSKPGKERK